INGEDEVHNRTVLWEFFNLNLAIGVILTEESISNKHSAIWLVNKRLKGGIKTTNVEPIINSVDYKDM
ncbi:10082_t:CDS:1, partial [Gigaspora margarita]